MGHSISSVRQQKEPLQSRSIQASLCSNYNDTVSLMPSGQSPGLHPDTRECLYDEKVAHRRRGTDDKDVPEQRCKSTTVENQTNTTRKENAEQRSRSGKRRDTGDTKEEESSASSICFVSLNISLGTDWYSKRGY